MLIKDIFKVKHQEGEVAVEVEVEGMGLPSPPIFWHSAHDGSLKMGPESVEYVMDFPINRSSLLQTLKDFEQSFSISTVAKSPYAGIHTHINVQNLTPKQLITYICCFIVLEDFLVEWCGETRIGNHFCLRTSDAEFLIHFIRNMILKNNILICNNNDNIRYSSVNLKSLGKYGSLEFRTLGSTINADRIYTWCSVLLNILDKSKEYSTPDKIIVDIKQGGMLPFIKKMFGDYYYAFITDDYINKIKHGMLRAQDITHCKDWTNKNYNIFLQTNGVF